jgi:pheromone shutdown protein TraB
LNLILKFIMTDKITAVERDPVASSSTILEHLRDSGFVTIATHSSQDAVSDEELEALVRSLPTVAPPTSQTLIEERNERW